MSLYWGRDGRGWEPQGGERREWRDLQPGDLIAADRKIWRVVEVRPVPVADWDEDDQAYRDARFGTGFDPMAIRPKRPASEEAWDRRPLYLIVVPADGGKRHHVRVRPYATYRDAYVLPQHYPVCKDCGEPWPCREVDIAREVEREAAKLAELEKILPGCCWSCGEPVTHRQSAIRFDGDNLLLPGAPSPVFHLRRKEGCRSGAAGYERRWVPAGEDRRWRLQCPGSLIVHVDGRECSEDPFCPGAGASHGTYMRHTFGRREDGSIAGMPGLGAECLRCKDALERDGFSVGDPPPGALL